jgi:hypothetical protein
MNIQETPRSVPYLTKQIKCSRKKQDDAKNKGDMKSIQWLFDRRRATGHNGAPASVNKEGSRRWYSKLYP